MQVNPNNDREWAEWLVEAKKRDDQQKSVLAANPNGGCYYRPHVMMVHSGHFWRCAHGLTSWFRWCPRCALAHPILAFRWHFGSPPSGEVGK